MKRASAGKEAWVSAALARRLLATSSLVSLIAGAGGAAQAACYTGPFGFTNNSNLSCVNVTNTSFTGSITNTGTISPGGINLTSATITGQIVDTGTIAGGITLDSHSSIIASGPAININSTSSFGGGITNNGGTIHSSSTGIAIGGGGAVSTFSGNIVNSGSITGSGPGILITSVSSFLGGITNNGGTIGSDGGSAPGILISNVSSFSGGIAINGGSVTGQDAPGISIVNVSNFSNGIFNSGTITGNPCCGAGTGVLIQQVSTFSGGVTNTGTIQGSCGAGLRINTVSQFNGNIFNGGTISGAICCNAAGIGVLIQGVSTFTGNVTNTGKITGNCGDGLRIVNVTKLVGNISNGGTISGRSGNGITLGISTFQGQIINTGLISGQVGIYLSGEGVGSTSNVSIFNSGTITGTAGPTPTAIEFGGGTNTLTLGPGYVFNGIVVGTGHDIFQLGGSGNGTLNLGLINSTSQFRGFNTFNVVSGNWTAFGTFSNCCAEGANGPWMVLQGGTLNVVGDLSQASSLTVNSGGKVMGYGFLPNTTILDGGTLAPGGPLFELGASNPGDGVGAPVPSLVLPNTNVLTIQGNLSMGSAANYLVQVYSTTSTKTIVTGTANIGGYLIANAAGGPYTLGQTYTVMTDTNGIHGTFSLLETTGNFGPYRPVITYDADDVFLTMQYAIFAPLLPSNATINERNTAQALDAFVLGGGALPPGFSNIFNFTPQQILNALNQLTGEVGTGAQQTSFQLMNEFMDLLFGAPGGPGGGGGMMSFAPARQDFPDDVALAYASVLKAPPALARSPLSVWAASYGGANRTDGDPIVMGSADLTAKTFGTAVGLEDQISPDTNIGVALAGAGGGWTLSGGLGSGTSNAVQGGIYGARQLGPAYVSGALTGASYWMTTTRSVNTPALPADTLKASFAAQSLGGRLEAGYRLPSGMGYGIIPYAAVQVQAFWTPAYAEGGLLGAADPFALSFGSREATATRSELGSRFDHLVPMADGTLGLFGRLAWAHDWQSNVAIQPAFLSLPTPTFVINGAPVAPNKALTTLGGEYRMRNGWSVMGKFDGEFANRSATYAGTAQVKYTW